MWRTPRDVEQRVGPRSRRTQRRRGESRGPSPDSCGRVALEDCDEGLTLQSLISVNDTGLRLRKPEFIRNNRYRMEEGRGWELPIISGERQSSLHPILVFRLRASRSIPLIADISAIRGADSGISVRALE